MCVHCDWQNRKTEHFSSKCPGLLSTASAQPPPQSAVLACFGLGWRRMVRKRRYYTFPSVAFSGGCLRSILAFDLNAHTFYFPYCAPAHLQSLLATTQKPHKGPTPESVKVQEDLQKPLQQWNFIQRAERWQSIVSSLSPMMPNAAKRVKVMFLIRALLRTHCPSPGLSVPAGTSS